ncbi:MAG TPA: penicillin-binding transpeptidase domain-containing protein, partial [Polyangiaceae bacterium]|nr:penicillin-binding transpeptidase domain-containing protein [Polyangiaceae bacterium]
LELGVLDDAESEMPWDGKTYSVPDWNRDHTLRTAMRVSCLPCFQSVARKIGPARLGDWVTRFAYGNHDTSGAPERFWLDGALRISPVQQIEFLRKLDEDKLPIQKRTSEIVKDVITLDVGQNHVLRGKTGLLRPPEERQFFGWFVGWVELGPRRVYFATLLDAVEPDVDPVPVRRRLTETILRSQQLLP